MPGKKHKITAAEKEAAAPAAQAVANIVTEQIVKNKRTYKKVPVVEKIHKLINQECARQKRASTPKPKKTRAKKK